MNVAFEIFGLEVKWYGIIIALGVLVACMVAVYNCKRKNFSEDLPFELLLWCFPLAIVGARLYYIAFSGQTYTFMEAISIWNGGMAIYGGLIGGVIGLILYSIIRKQNFLQTLDIMAPSLIIAQSIGRWGNFANQEVYGTVVNNPDLQFFPFSVYIDALGEWHYATFFYESMLNLAGFFLLMWLFKRNNLHGLVAGAYLVLYGIVRFFLEGIRETTEILFIPGTEIMVSQVVSLILVAIGVGLIVYLLLNEKRKRQGLKATNVNLTEKEKMSNNLASKTNEPILISQEESEQNTRKFEKRPEGNNDTFDIADKNVNSNGDKSQASKSNNSSPKE